jgi:hypothetical protein
LNARPLSLRDPAEAIVGGLFDADWQHDCRRGVVAEVLYKNGGLLYLVLFLGLLRNIAAAFESRVPQRECIRWVFH